MGQQHVSSQTAPDNMMTCQHFSFSHSLPHFPILSWRCVFCGLMLTVTHRHILPFSLPSHSIGLSVSLSLFLLIFPMWIYCLIFLSGCYVQDGLSQAVFLPNWRPNLRTDKNFINIVLEKRGPPKDEHTLFQKAVGKRNKWLIQLHT